MLKKQPAVVARRPHLALAGLNIGQLPDPAEKPTCAVWVFYRMKLGL